MNYSKQREVILKTLQENMIHPTADVLYSLLKEKCPTMSLATVYRNLNLLAQNGVIKKIEGLDGTAHFDHNTSKHYHFICTKCHKVFDLPYDIAPGLAEKIYAETGLVVESHDVSCKGICHDCMKTNLNS